MLYTFTGTAENPEAKKGESIGYDLLPLYNTLWQRAQNTPNETFGESQEYQEVKFMNALDRRKTAEKALSLNKLGSAFLGKVGAENMARPPWGWFDSSERDSPLGEWFFNSAVIIKRHFKFGDQFSVAYTHNPYLNIFR